VTRRFDAAGTPSGPSTPLAGTSGLRAPRLVWDGQEYVLAAAAAKVVGPADLVACWLDANGAARGGGFTTVAPLALGSGVPLRAASDGAGNTLVSFMRFQDQRAVAYVLSSAPATLPEAGAPDAGTPDDGGPSEAGLTDAGTSDATAPDAGPRGVDAGPYGSTDPGSDSGCGCSAAGARSPLLPAGTFAMLVLLSLCRLRRARRDA
jgi:hypothetical protein